MRTSIIPGQHSLESNSEAATTSEEQHVQDESSKESGDDVTNEIESSYPHGWDLDQYKIYKLQEELFDAREALKGYIEAEERLAQSDDDVKRLQKEIVLLKNRLSILHRRGSSTSSGRKSPSLFSRPSHSRDASRTSIAPPSTTASAPAAPSTWNAPSVHHSRSSLLRLSSIASQASLEMEYHESLLRDLVVKVLLIRCHLALSAGAMNLAEEFLTRAVRLARSTQNEQLTMQCAHWKAVVSRQLRKREKEWHARTKASVSQTIVEEASIMDEAEDGQSARISILLESETPAEVLDVPPYTAKQEQHDTPKQFRRPANLEVANKNETSFDKAKCARSYEHPGWHSRSFSQNRTSSAFRFPPRNSVDLQTELVSEDTVPTSSPHETAFLPPPTGSSIVEPVVIPAAGSPRLVVMPSAQDSRTPSQAPTAPTTNGDIRVQKWLLGVENLFGESRIANKKSNPQTALFWSESFELPTDSAKGKKVRRGSI